MRGPEVQSFAAAHGLKYVTIADLIAHRQAREKLVERVSEFTYRPRSEPSRAMRV